jgi:hypothetical protein
MTPQQIFTDTVRPVLGWLWTDHRVPNGPAAEAMLLAIGLQESRLTHRDQIVAGKAPGQVGPATGFWQFERNGGVAGVMQHARSAAIARAAADAAGVAWDRDAIWRSFTTAAGDDLAACFARLLLFTDPAPLPACSVSAEDEAWNYYLRDWRPGKPHRATWGGFWAQGVALAGSDAPAPPAPAQDSLAARVAALEARLDRMAAALAR